MIAQRHDSKVAWWTVALLCIKYGATVARHPLLQEAFFVQNLNRCTCTRGGNYRRMDKLLSATKDGMAIVHCHGRMKGDGRTGHIGWHNGTAMAR